ncbi:hypothetical protein HPB51_025071 [Rhipicephalus microplus]|uniref:Uncharacterized protein n=1 Tax=Rhipicephalus microplus TaxID=6941 RepID=A0A9J6DK28_RHIMP|nr:hypothetical protein HPB51_025071 [Rhipicephalus microplus]
MGYPSFISMSKAESQREHAPRFLTPPSTPRRVIAYQEKLKQTFNPSVFLQNFNFPIPFRRKPKPKPSEDTTVFPTPYKTLYHPRAARYQPFRRSEFIELANFGVVEIDPTESGVGHDFEPVVFKNPTWCDLCGDFVWGACSLQQGLQCQNCNFTCHLRCRSFVALDCKGQGEMETSDLSEQKQDERKEGNGRISPLFLEDLPRDELMSRIQSYNLQEPGLDMVLQEDGSVRGFVRVRMNLMRPINVVAGTRPPSIYNILKDEDSDRKTLTSFYLPRDTIKALHITSVCARDADDASDTIGQTSDIVDEACKTLLAEVLERQGITEGISFPHFRDADSDVQTSTDMSDEAIVASVVEVSPNDSDEDDMESDNTVKLRKLQDTDKPLWLALDWNSRTRQFVLQENDNSDIEWEDFAVPELQNFLKILDLEEEEYLTQLKLKYDLVRSKIQEAMDSFPKPENEVPEVEGSEPHGPERAENVSRS